MTLPIETIYFTAPAWIGNSVAAVACYFLKRFFVLVPIDGDNKWKGKAIFGPNKTVMGALITAVAASLIGAIQGNVEIGFVMGIAVVFGSLANSFVKRRLNISPGGNIIFFDQTDYVWSVFAMLFVAGDTPWFFSFWWFFLFVFFYQLFINFIAFKMGFLRSSPIDTLRGGEMVYNKRTYGK